MAKPSKAKPSKAKRSKPVKESKRVEESKPVKTSQPAGQPKPAQAPKPAEVSKPAEASSKPSKCGCQSANHGHRPGRCARPATEADGHCGFCHSKGAADAIAAQNPYVPSSGGRGDMPRPKSDPPVE